MAASGDWIVEPGHEANLFAVWTAAESPVLCEPLGATNMQRPAGRAVAK
jgi:hypothetical protein